jgi:hypothetical protein
MTGKDTTNTYQAQATDPASPLCLYFKPVARGHCCETLDV